MRSRKELERLIVDASDGVLTTLEIRKLEKELRHHPDLYRDYRAIMKLPDLSHLYQADLEDKRYQSSINNILKGIQNIPDAPDSFEAITLNWFRRYALAASLAVFAITSVFSFVQSGNGQADSEIVIEELFYPVEENAADNYVLYLQDLTED